MKGTRNATHGKYPSELSKVKNTVVVIIVKLKTCDISLRSL